MIYDFFGKRPNVAKQVGTPLSGAAPTHTGSPFHPSGKTKVTAVTSTVGNAQRRTAI